MKPQIEIFETMAVPKAILKSAVPVMVSMLVVLVYNIADTFFVGQTGDPMQVAAVSLAMPVFLLFMATGNLIGIGGTSVISRALGAKRPEYAESVSSFCFYASWLIGIVFMFLFWALMPMILKLIGTSPDTYEHTKVYLTFVAPSAPFVIVATAFSNIIRAEGKSSEAVIGTMLGTVVNIILDPIMILGLHMGVAGAAIATLIGNFIAMSYYLFYFLRGKSRLSISPRRFRMSDGILTGVIAIGIPAALNNVLMSASSITMNNFLAGYGDIQVAAMGVAMKVMMIVVLLQIGLGAGIQPLLGYSYGAENRNRFKSIIRTSLLYSFALGLTLTLLCWINASAMVRSFINDEAVFSYSITFVKALLISGPVVGILFVFINALQATGAAGESLILSISRQGFVFIPSLILLNILFGLSGIVYAQPAADVVSIGISAALFLTRMGKWRKLKVAAETE